MPLSSLDKIRQIRKGMGNPTLGEVTDQDIAVYLHLAEKNLAAIHEFPSLATYEDVTLDGSTDYTLTETNVLKLLEPPTNVTSNFPMDVKTMRWDRQVGERISSGTPYAMIVISLAVGVCTVRFRPVGSSGTIRVPYIKIPTYPGATASAENFSDLPEAFDMTEISLGTAIGLELTNQKGDAKDELALGSMHLGAADRALTKNDQHYYLATAAHRLLGRKGKRR